MAGDAAATMRSVPSPVNVFVFQTSPVPGAAGDRLAKEPEQLPVLNNLKLSPAANVPPRLVTVSVPPEQRRTKTNIRKLTANTSLMESGLFGPVQILCSPPDKAVKIKN